MSRVEKMVELTKLYMERNHLNEEIRTLTNVRDAFTCRSIDGDKVLVLNKEIHSKQLELNKVLAGINSLEG